ncbi:MAG: ABC transporter permease subunit [Roseiflexaceae bacterium]|nr:ABC transporter permease subunit [Roseiflexaceae bacterium]
MKILAILWKEWLELRRERSLLISLFLPPLLLTLMPIGIMIALRDAPDDDTSKLGIVLADPTLAGMNTADLGQAVMGKQFSLLMLLTPVLLSGIIAAYSIVGEKTGRTLEPLLATPIKTWELLLAKCLTALIPAVGTAWVSAAIFAIGVGSVANSPQVAEAVLNPAWTTVLIFCSPSLALIAIAMCVAISSRVNDPRTAQQITAVAIIPLMAIFFAQMAGALVLNVPLALGAAIVLALIAAGSLWAAVQLFQREAILTRWR